jgi:hypothetical protein
MSFADAQKTTHYEIPGSLRFLHVAAQISEFQKKFRSFLENSGIRLESDFLSASPPIHLPIQSHLVEYV